MSGQISGKFDIDSIMVSSNQTDMKKEFEDWCLHVDHRDESYIKQCCRILLCKTNEGLVLARLLGHFTSVFEIADPAYVGDLYDRVKILPENRDGHNRISAAVKKYQSFLRWRLSSSAVLDSTSSHGSSVKKRILAVSEYIASRGFIFPRGMIENFYLSLISKPFVILAGVSVTGKTRLTMLFAEAIGARYEVVPVRPDWSDSSDLFGHVDLNGDFVPGSIIDFVKEANDNPDTPHILCLDEMNLARVEYYLSDFLSVIEMRNRAADGSITTYESLVPDYLFGDDEDARRRYSDLPLPPNLYMVGTVNMDETTFAFSKKVLDRANTIEFSYIDFTAPTIAKAAAKPDPWGQELMQAPYLTLREIDDDSGVIDKVNAMLTDINRALEPIGMQVGYRVRDEISFYMVVNSLHGLLLEVTAMDNQIMQKVLPRIQGNSQAVKDALVELFGICIRDRSGLQSMSSLVAPELRKRLGAAQGREDVYVASAAKIVHMVERLEFDGFTSYWL